MAINNCDQFTSECEKEPLDERSKKFKIININQVTNGDGNKYQQQQKKTQLIEIDKLIINSSNENGPKDGKKSSKIGVWHQILMTGAILLLACSAGMPIGYSVVILPQLVNHPSDALAMDFEMASWVASIHSLATPMGSLVSTPIMNAYGRKNTLLLSIMPLLCGWSIIALSTSHFAILTGRVACGIAVGLMAAPSQILLAEISQANLRGILVGIPFVSYSCGILLVYGLGSILNWRTVAWCAVMMPIFSFIAIALAPESPNWLARKGYYDKAKKALAWLRDSDETARIELKQTIEHIENEKNNRSHKSQSIWSIIKQPSVLKPIILINAFNILQILSGTYLIVFYAVDIITEICNFGDDDAMKISTMQSAVLTALIRLILTMVYCYLILKWKRRSLYLTSFLFSAITSLTLSIFLYSKGDSTKSFNDLIIIGVLMLLYISANTCSMLMPGVMVGELLPLRVRHWSGMIFTAFNLMLFIVTKAFPWLKIVIRTQGLFLMFGCSSLCAFMLFFWLLPETKDKTLNDIEDYYQESNWIWQKRVKKTTNGSDQS